MSRCKHENAEHMMPGDASTPDWCVQVYAEFEQFRCIDCGAWLSLGPSDEEPVRVEVRAAEIAADEDAKMSMCESFGWESWLVPRFSTDPVDQGYADKWHAGYLACCIAEHGGE